MRPRAALVIANPATGRKPIRAFVDELNREAAARGVALTIEMTRRPGHAVELARSVDPAIETIIAVGGDGTVSEVVSGVIGRSVAIGIIPAGSSNMIAKDLNIPRDIRRAARVALGDGQAVAVDVARAGRATFLHIAGAGFDAAVMRDTTARWKRRVGWLAYLPSAIRHARYPRFTATMNIDNRTVALRARLVLCAIGGSIIHPRFRVGVGIDRCDGIIDVCVYNPPGAFGAFTCVAWIIAGHPERSRWLTQLRGRRIALGADRPIPFEVDGDHVGELPIEIEMLPNQARVLVPRDRAVLRA